MAQSDVAPKFGTFESEEDAYIGSDERGLTFDGPPQHQQSPSSSSPFANPRSRIDESSFYPQYEEDWRGELEAEEDARSHNDHSRRLGVHRSRGGAQKEGSTNGVIGVVDVSVKDIRTFEETLRAFADEYDWEQQEGAYEILGRLMRNLIDHANEGKFRRFQRGNARIRSRLLCLDYSEKLLELLGFEISHDGSAYEFWSATTCYLKRYLDALNAHGTAEREKEARRIRDINIENEKKRDRFPKKPFKEGGFVKSDAYSEEKQEALRKLELDFQEREAEASHTVPYFLQKASQSIVGRSNDGTLTLGDKGKNSSKLIISGPPMRVRDPPPAPRAIEIPVESPKLTGGKGSILDFERTPRTIRKRSLPSIYSTSMISAAPLGIPGGFIDSSRVVTTREYTTTELPPPSARSNVTYMPTVTTTTTSTSPSVWHYTSPASSVRVIEGPTYSSRFATSPLATASTVTSSNGYRLPTSTSFPTSSSVTTFTAAPSPLTGPPAYTTPGYSTQRQTSTYGASVPPQFVAPSPRYPLHSHESHTYVAGDVGESPVPSARHRRYPAP